MHRIWRLLVPALCLVLPVQAFAQGSACDRLSGEKKALVEDLLRHEHPYDCCDDTLANCLKQQPPCALLVRLVENLCHRVEANQTREQIQRWLALRGRSMVAVANVPKIDLASVPVAGEDSAPVTLVEYACPRCPLCGRLTPLLHQAVVSGTLQGKVRLYLKVFPIRSHEGSKEAALALLAAHRLGWFWPFALYVLEHFAQFEVGRLADWAGKVGLPQQDFEKLLADPALLDELLAIKKEGIINKVESTPTFFIDGRRYDGELTPDELIDVLSEEHERVTEKR